MPQKVLANSLFCDIRKEVQRGPICSSKLGTHKTGVSGWKKLSKNIIHVGDNDSNFQQKAIHSHVFAFFLRPSKYPLEWNFLTYNFSPPLRFHLPITIDQTVEGRWA